MADITNNEMRELLQGLSDRLDSTSGDRSTVDKLDELKSILNRIQIDLGKAGTNSINTAAISRAVSDAINHSNQRSNVRPSSNRDLDAGNSEVTKARQEFINEYRKASDALRNNTVANTGSNNSRNPFSSVIENRLDGAVKTGKASAEFAALSKVLKSAGVDISNYILKQADVYRQMTNAGQTFGGSITELNKEALASGLSTDSFVKALVDGTSAVKQLGSQTFTAFTRSMNDSMKSVNYFGMSIDDAQKGFGDYLESQKYSEGLNKITSQSASQGFSNLVAAATDLSAAFGEDRDQLLKNINAAAKDPTNQALTSGLSNGAKTQTNQLLGAVSDNPNMLRLFREGLGLSQNVVLSGTGNDEIANRPMLEQVARGMRAIQSGQMTNEQFLKEFKQSAIQEQQAIQTQGGQRKVFLYGNSDLDNTMLNAENVANSAASLNLQGVDDGKDKGKTPSQQIANADPLTKSILTLQTTINNWKLLQDATAAAALNAMKNTITSLLTEINDAGAKLPDLAQKIMTTSNQFEALDKQLAQVIKDMGPLGLALTGLTGLMIAKIGLFGGAFKAFTTPARMATRAGQALGQKTANALRGGRPSAAGRGASEAVVKESEGIASRTAEQAASRAASKTVSEALTDALGKVLKFGTGMVGGVVLETIIDAQQNKLNGSENKQTIQQAAGEKDNKAGGWEDKAFQKMTNTERQHYETLIGAKRDEYLKEIYSKPVKALSIPPNPNKSDNIEISKKPSTKESDLQQNNNDKQPQPQLPSILTKPKTKKSNLPDTSDLMSFIPNYGDNFGEAPDVVKSIEQTTDSTRLVLQKQLEAMNSQHDMLMLTNKKIYDILKQIESNTGDTSKNVLKNGNRIV